MKAKLIKESIGKSSTYEQFVEEIYDIMTNRGVSIKTSDEAMSYWHSKGYIENYWRDGFSPEETYTELREMNYFK